jgi:hypothetical protein
VLYQLSYTGFADINIPIYIIKPSSNQQLWYYQQLQILRVD